MVSSTGHGIDPNNTICHAIKNHFHSIVNERKNTGIVGQRLEGCELMP